MRLDEIEWNPPASRAQGYSVATIWHPVFGDVQVCNNLDGTYDFWVPGPRCPDDREGVDVFQFAVAILPCTPSPQE